MMLSDEQRAPLKVGFHCMDQCPRGRTDCKSLLHIASSEGAAPTFICCGEVLNGATVDPRDPWAFCIRADQTRQHCAGTDIHIFLDRQDISHMAAVLTYARANIDSADLFNPAFEEAIAYRPEPKP